MRRGAAGWRTALLLVLLLAGTVLSAHLMRAQPDTPRADQDTRRLTQAVDLAEPFAGTPVRDWADGADGIVPPPARAVGDFDAEQVRAALARVREILVAARLDRSLIEGGDVDPLVSLLAESQQTEVRGMLTTTAWDDTYATRIAPGFRLAEAEPKVRGRMSVRPGDREGSLTIKTDYTFAYAFDIDDPARVRDQLDLVAGVRWELDFLLYEGERWFPEDRGIMLGSGRGSRFAVACAPAVEGLLAPALGEPASTPGSTELTAREFFDPARPLPEDKGCA